MRVARQRTEDKSIASHIQGLCDEARQCTKLRMQRVSEKLELFQEIEMSFATDHLSHSSLMYALRVGLSLIMCSRPNQYEVTILLSYLPVLV